MDKFAEKGIPLTVATIDMDWHLVDDVPEDAGTTMKWVSPGWTGYTFNRKLFPDYPKFFRDLKERGLAITMNLHPHDGIRYFEDQYEDMAKANGIDPATKQPVAFDFTDLNFVKSYFDLVLHPYEEQGVDFWWIDWQQGDTSRLAGLDPLWLLNHYHTLDAGRDGRTPLILSRYSGVGAIVIRWDFPGDTIVTWSSLRYQPYLRRRPPMWGTPGGPMISAATWAAREIPNSIPAGCSTACSRLSIASIPPETSGARNPGFTGAGGEDRHKISASAPQASPLSVHGECAHRRGGYPAGYAHVLPG